MFTVANVFAPDYRPSDLAALRQDITQNYAVDESAWLARLLEQVPASGPDMAQLEDQARRLVTRVREDSDGGDGIDAFLQQYSLDTQEGIILMCLAEALLRIPDSHTADELIKDKLSGADWAKHFRQSDSTLVNASTWGLMLTGRIVRMDKKLDGNPANVLSRMINRLGEPVVRSAMYGAMKIMGKQFVLGRSISEALKASRKSREQGYTHSYDMLGEAAMTADDAEKYRADYASAIAAVGGEKLNNPAVPRPSISIKLSALHPRYEEANRERVLTELYATVQGLLETARKLDVFITIDAEEMDRLELSLELFEKLYRSDVNKGWGGLGLVVQAYSKRALPVLCWLTALAREQGDEIPLRLVKGAYWDSEIKHSQQAGLDGYPVYTRKAGTDVAYLVCARYLLSAATEGAIYPQFATHNAHTVVAVLNMAGQRRYEFQRLHGMGEELYDAVLADNPGLNCRIYAPVGAHKDLLPYLVRRLLENGANTSFVHKLVDPDTPIDSLITHPVTSLRECHSLANDKIPLPHDIFADRKNSAGFNLNIEAVRTPLFRKLEQLAGKSWQAAPLVGGKVISGEKRPVISPQNRAQQVGEVVFADQATVEQAITHAQAAFKGWRDAPVETRAQALEKLADLLESHSAEFISLCTREAGKLLQDGIDEVREAVDFCRYYANEGRRMMHEPTKLPGYTGELNLLQAQGRGPFVCISPWNFPLAIFLGQVSAALITGNTVLAKPAEQTSLIAHLAVTLAHQAGIPGDVLQLLPGDGATVGAALTQDPRIAGVCFTGSTDTAQLINMTLAKRSGAIVPLVAETGGQNAMIVDSTALPEQVVRDVLRAAFQSAGQRCSALRVLYLQDDIADRVLEILEGAMQELSVADPALWSTDVGPVIDADAQAGLQAHLDAMKAAGHKVIAEAPMSEACANGYYLRPTALEVGSIGELSKEQFGPILHVVRFRAKDIDKVIDDINATGYGLTLGVHSRNESFAAHVAKRAEVGNVYINRDQIGAMVGVQPFGGRGLSGTGPKAGGPHYLTRFITEKTITNNTTAIGGNATLLSLGEG
ncbi:bifunctional proline dehydrogenase/L-glutamate gamma-semialdehyde dehydrogenase PutA [Oceanimonas sp. CHS3-5]|uniref:bifunctional proline dehydrogenase/L-glutamate gamma-semialdehyde dehydrogenase PutA n=1 Tax=Oceanimonas sp. CHS3-5 TaxID=3068186 RepID=UPI00273E133B|nr:bifunctional proline dehydrogenase/L-glutamate gamma-semialdehyde dehydrogenase PutA [Oceanimonas sp. CHS3-5]MDP5292090.1 bifunctional proline dehydrogenase/L-glutamate gamma-semialdehyde dehydrogenase PutA [Oceanimonas sp. CHS3-5]